VTKRLFATLLGPILLILFDTSLSLAQTSEEFKALRNDIAALKATEALRRELEALKDGQHRSLDGARRLRSGQAPRNPGGWFPRIASGRRAEG